MPAVPPSLGLNPASDKYLGRVYTPKWVVNRILEPLFRGSLENIKICDPACGEGDFLAPIVSEICHRMRDTRDGDRTGLWSTLEHISGYDVDAAAVKNCRHRLTGIVKAILGESQHSPDWRIRHADALDAWRHDAGTFDWTVGNPPYVRIQHLEAERREKIKCGRWTYFCGASDLYIVFFELGLRLLKDGGTLAFISPSGWLRNDAGKNLRDDLRRNHGIRAIYDFRDHQVFPGVSTYTCITQVRKGGGATAEAYLYSGDRFTNSCKLVQSGSMWAVMTLEAAHRYGRESVVRLGDIARIQVGIQTLADKVFILEVVDQDEHFVMVEVDGDQFPIESKAVRRILKASVMKGGCDKVERVVIYPYDQKGSLFQEEVFNAQFPLAYAWLRSNKPRLLSRDKGTFNPDKWFGFGREVGIRSAFGNKILTSGMNPAPNFQICNDPKVLFYSGYSVKPIFPIPLAALVSELNSDKMAEYVRTFAQPFRGGWYSYAKRYIQDFPVSRNLLQL